MMTVNFPFSDKIFETPIINSSKDKFYLELKDYINLIRSAGFRPGIEPLKIKRFQFNFITDKDNPTEPILMFNLFGTKTKEKHSLTCHPYFTFVFLF